MKVAATEAALKSDERVGKRNVLMPISFVYSFVLVTVVGTEDAGCCHTLPAPFLLCRCGQDAALCCVLKSTPRSVTVTNFPDCFTEKKQPKRRQRIKKLSRKCSLYIKYINKYSIYT